MGYRIKNAFPLKKYKLCIQFVEGKTVIFDMEPVFEKFPAFKELQVNNKFKHFKVDNFGIVWNERLDLDGDNFYYDGDVISTPFDSVVSFSEATRMWKLSESTLRKAVQYGKFRQGVDCMKYGRTWIVTIEAMLREYGESEIYKKEYIYNKNKSLID